VSLCNLIANQRNGQGLKMKLDPDIIRQLLLDIEEQHDGPEWEMVIGIPYSMPLRSFLRLALYLR
jgi:hypothetical protein